IFQVGFQVTPPVSFSNEVGPLRIEEILAGLDAAASPFDLALQVIETDEDLVGLVQYATDLFDEGTVERWMSDFRVLLEAAVVGVDWCGWGCCGGCVVGAVGGVGGGVAGCVVGGCGVLAFGY